MKPGLTQKQHLQLLQRTTPAISSYETSANNEICAMNETNAILVQLMKLITQ